MFSSLSTQNDGCVLTTDSLASAPPMTSDLDSLLFGMQCVALEPAQAHSPKLISHVSGSLTLYSKKLSSFELHLLIYSAREWLTPCVHLCPGGLWEWSDCLLSESHFTRWKDLTSSISPITPDLIILYLTSCIQKQLSNKIKPSSSQENQCSLGPWC